MTKAAIEAIVYALLAPSQPITAVGKHQPSMQALIDELYDQVSRSKVLAQLAQVLTFTTGDEVLIFRSGEGKKVPYTLFSGMKFQGAYNLGLTNQYPISGGSGPAGAIVAGDMFYVSVAGTLNLGSGVEDVVVKSLLIALTNAPGTDPAKWRMI